MRVYVHYADDPEHCMVYPVKSPGLTVGSMRAAFARDYIDRHGAAMSPPFAEQGQVVSLLGRRMLRDSSLVATVLQDREDCFIIVPCRRSAEGKDPEISQPESHLQPEHQQQAQQQQQQQLPKQNPKLKKQLSRELVSAAATATAAMPAPRELKQPPKTLGLQEIMDQLTSAQGLRNKGRLRSARDIYISLLPSLAAVANGNGNGSGNNIKAADHDALVECRRVIQQSLGLIHLRGKRPKQAVKCIKEAVALATRTKPSTPVDRVNLAMLHALHGRALFACGSLVSACDQFNLAIATINAGGKKQPQQYLQLAAGHTESFQIWLARCMLKISPSARSKGISLIEAAVNANQDNPEALAHYCSVAVEVGQGLNALPHLLRALVAAQQNKNADPDSVKLSHKLFAKVVSGPGGLPALITHMGTAADQPSALMFLATTLRDQGAVDGALHLQRLALTASKGKADETASNVLTHAHTLELVGDYQGAIDVMLAYLERHPARTVGSLRADAILLIVGALASTAPSSSSTTTASSKKSKKSKKKKKKQDKLTGIHSPLLRSGEHEGCPAYGPTPTLVDAGTVQVKVPESHKSATAAEENDENNKDKAQESSITSAISSAISCNAENPTTYTEAELSQLAIYFALAKICFAVGALQPIPALITAVEPLRRGQMLHFTAIRNEHAYYCFVAQIMPLVPFPTISKEATKTLYVCGDSHCLAPSYATVSLGKGKPTMQVQPMLVTGIKCWHLRPDEQFYPKKNWDHAIKAIPEGSMVVFVLGEIDCREGLLHAVEQTKYESLQEGIDVTIKVYIRALESVVQARRFTAFVHPVNPVLTVTRAHVDPFNVSLAKAVKASRSLQWLGFHNKLLSADGTFDAQRYGLDGTHLSPSYVPLLEAELQAAVAQKK